MAGRISMGARREELAAVVERYRSASRVEGRVPDELCATTGWHRKHAVRALSARTAGKPAGEGDAGQHRRRSYEGVRDALVALWEASDRVCGNENTRVHAPGRVAVCMYADGAAGYGYKPDQAAPSLRGGPTPERL
jgi:hypothetical protein